MTESAETGAWRATVLALEPDQVLAFLHEPALAVNSTAVLLCPPFGWDEMCSYRSRRVWAQSLAAAGYPAARFDLPSTGDSAGTPRDPARLAAWLRATIGAATWLRETTDATRLVAVGLGLGGTLAAIAAAESSAIDDLILWGVHGSGRTMMREMRAYAAIVRSAFAEDADPDAGRDRDLELIGYRLSDESRRALEQIRLTSLPLNRADRRRVLLVGRDGRSVSPELEAHFRGLGADVDTAGGVGYSAMMTHPERALAPQETIAETTAWLDQSRTVPRPALRAGRHPSERDELELRHDGVLVREKLMTLHGVHGDTLAIVSEPGEGERLPITVVLLNSGLLRHTGPNRMWVEAARRWAARGATVVRVDNPGIGDADGDLPRPVRIPDFYTPEQTARAGWIVDQLAAHGLPGRFVLGGLCSGSYWALRAALADPRVASLLLINLPCFQWRDSLVTEREPDAFAAALHTLNFQHLMRRGLRREDLRKALRGLRAGAAALVTRSGAVDDAPEAHRALDQLRDQSTQLLLLFGRGEPLHRDLARWGILDDADRWPNLTVERIPTRDHMFRALRLQSHVHSSIDRALERALAADHAQQPG